MMFHIIAVQSSSVWSRGQPRYLKVDTPYIIAPPSTLYMLKTISPLISAIYTSLRLIHLSVTLLCLSVRLYLNSLAYGICIRH